MRVEEIKNKNGIILELSDIQMAYFLGRNSNFELGNISTHGYYEIRTKLDIDKIQFAVNKMIRNQIMLRSTVLSDGTLKIFDDVPQYNIDVKDHSKSNGYIQQMEISKIRNEMSHYLHEFNNWPFFDIKALKLDEHIYYLFFSFDLLIADGISLIIFLKQLLEYYYEPKKELMSLDEVFQKFILIEKEIKTSKRYERDKKYWESKLLEIDTPPLLPLIMSPADIKTPKYSRIGKVFEEKTWKNIKNKAKENGISPSAFILTIFSKILSHYCNQTQLTINLTLSDKRRRVENSETLIGDFTSSVLVQVNMDEIDSKDDFISESKHVNNMLIYSLLHSSYSGVEVIRDLSKFKKLGSKAVMPIVFTSMITGEERGIGIIEELGEVVFCGSQTPQVYLDNQIVEYNGGVQITWDYVEELFDKEFIEGMFTDYERLIIQCSQSNFSKIPLLDEHKHILDEYNNTSLEIHIETLNQLFVKQVNKNRDKTAVKKDEMRITFGELDDLSNQTAHFLHSNYVIQENSVIGVVVTRKIETIVNILGVLKAGCGYVPVNPEFPVERQQYILSDSNCLTVLDESNYKKNKICDYSREAIDFSKVDNVAYIIYTSGSTGKPKGVIINHRAAANTILDINKKFNVTERDNVLGISSMCFDLSVYDIFGSLSSGASLVLINDQRNIQELIEVIDQKEITFWNSVPAIMGLLVQALPHNYNNSTLRNILLSGDWIPLNLPEELHNIFINSNVISLGGATEASIWSIYYPIEEVSKDWKSIPYGYPLSNQMLYILNTDLEVCPIGVPGEIYIGGTGVALGYINDQEKTNNSFIYHETLGYIYKTGDFGIMKKEGYIEFLGRKDSQVKIKGYRVELGEIESSILSYEGISSVSVVNIENDNKDKLLCAFISTDKYIEIDNLKKYLYSELPNYMVPTRFILLEQIPLTVNGKVDRQRLKKLYVESNEKERVLELPKNNTEKLIYNIWAELLGHNDFGVEDNFFEIGGDSIKAIQMITRIKEIGYAIKLQDIYSFQTISCICTKLTEKRADKKHCNLVINGEVEKLPITEWLFTQEIKNVGFWNFSQLVELPYDVSLELLNQCLLRIVEHHDALRATIQRNKNLYLEIQSIEEFNFTCNIIEVSGKNEDEENKKIKELSYNIQMELSKKIYERLFEAFVFRCDSGRNYLLLAMHHSIIDGVSLRMLLDNLERLYVTNLNYNFPEKGSSYLEWSQYINKYASENELNISYWSSIVGKTNQTRICNSEKGKYADFKRKEVELNQKYTRNIVSLYSKVMKVDIQTILLSALLESIYTTFNKSEILIDIESHGRENLYSNIDINQTMGWFTCIYPVLLEKGFTLEETIFRIKNTFETINSSGINFGIEKYIKRNKYLENFETDLAFNFLGEIVNDKKVFVLSNNFNIDICDKDNHHKYNLYVYGLVVDKKLQIKFDYNSNVFTEDQVNTLLIEFNNTLLKLANQVEENEFVKNYLDIYYSSEFELTNVQTAYYMGRKPDLLLGNISTHYYAEILLDLDIDKFSDALNKVIHKHPMLHTVFNSNITQKMTNVVTKYTFEFKDMRDNNISEIESYIQAYRDKMSHAISDLSKLPLFNFHIVRRNNDEFYLLADFDLIIADGASFQIFAKDLMYYYKNPDAPVEELHYTFKEYIRDLRNFKNTAIYREDQTYWRNKIESFPSYPRIPLKSLPKDVKKSKFYRKSAIIEKEKWSAIKNVAKTKAITPSALLCTIFMSTLRQFSNQDHMHINLTVFNRMPFHKDVEKIIGDFTSIALIDAKLTNDLEGNAKIVGNNILNALEHKGYDGIEFIRDLSRYRKNVDDIVSPIVFTSMLFDNASELTVFTDNMKYGISQTPQVFLDYQVMESNGDLRISWDYLEELFDEILIEKMFQSNLNVIHALVEEKNWKHKFTIDFEEYSLITQYNQTRMDYGITTLTSLFLDCVKKYPDKVAVRLYEDTITYKELNQKSNKIAKYIRTKKDEEGIVGVIASRKIETIVNIVGVLKAGSAYVPINPDFPAERKNFLIENSNCFMVLDENTFSNNDLENINGDSVDYSKENGLAYIIYTSGSTGKPKGVMINHSAAANTIMDVNYKFGIGIKDVIIGVSSLCFDLSVYDIFGALSTGAELVMIQDQRDIKDIIFVINKYNISFWNSVPAIMKLVVQNLPHDYKNSRMKNVLLSGDWIPLELPNEIKENFTNTSVISLGGATEASIWSIYFPIHDINKKWNSIPYGYPLANQQIYILDSNLEFCPMEVTGEIYIGGIGVANGYLQDCEKTRISFIQHKELGWIYKTGDYGIMHRDGYMKFVGRRDEQIKLGGYRVELGEIEHTIKAYEGVKDAIVIISNTFNDSKVLVGYLVLDKPDENVDELFGYLKEQLPHYMIPTHLIQIESIPLSPNGKVNRNALPGIVFENTKTQKFEEPRNELEKVMVKVWQEVLGVEKVSIHDSVFEIGGDSIKVVNIITKLISNNININIQDVFRYQTIARICELDSIYFIEEVLSHSIDNQEVLEEVASTIDGYDLDEIMSQFK